MAAKFAILAFGKSTSPCHIRIMSDNQTTVSYINHQGGHRSPPCNRVSREIWQWAEDRNIWISAAHIPGVENIDADEQSREFDDATEWSIPDGIFHDLADIWASQT